MWRAWSSHFCCRSLFGCYFFFFSSRRRHTRFDCDWSSDVCSSDLEGIPAKQKSADVALELGMVPQLMAGQFHKHPLVIPESFFALIFADAKLFEIGRAACRERG